MSDGTRRLLHVRQVECKGFLRGDGGFEVEGRLLDLTPEGTTIVAKEVAPGTAIHDMRLSLELDADLVITAVRVATPATPSVECPQAAAAYAALCGLQVGPGFNRAAKERVGGARGCTHLTELLGRMATTAMQTFYAHRRATRGAPAAVARMADSCHAYRVGGAALRRLEAIHQENRT